MNHSAVYRATGLVVVVCLILAVAAAPQACPQPQPQPQPAPLFDDWSERTGLNTVNGSGGVAFADLDNDGYPDVVISAWNLYRNEQGRGLKRLPNVVGLVPPIDANPMPSAQGIAFGDVNGDGHLDAFVFFMIDLANRDFKDHGRRNELWLGDGKGGFVLKKDTGLSTAPATTAAAGFFDFDGDGYLDLFTGNWFTRPWQSWDAMISPLYKGNGDGTFTDVTEKAGILGTAAPRTRTARRPIFCFTHTDYNNDGLQDMLVGTYAGGWNLLWKNNGDGTFTDVGHETTFAADEAGRNFILFGSTDNVDRFNVFLFSCPVADYDCDGDMDCFQGTIRHWDNRLTDPSMLLTNTGAAGGYKFQRDITRVPRTPVQFGMNWGDLHCAWLDVDNDGWEDLIIAGSDYPDEQLLRLFHQIPGTGRFEEWTDRLGFRWVSASNLSLADFDRDGATDILVSRNHMRLTPQQQQAYPLVTGLYRNLQPKRIGNGFFNLRLKGQAIGARVTITVNSGIPGATGPHKQIREVYGSLGIGGQRNDTDCRFGVGKATVIERVEVRWPDRPNTVQVFERIDPNKFYVLAKGGTLEVLDLAQDW